MQHPQLTFIIHNPNGLIQLATQPQLKGIKLVECNNCKQTYASKSENYGKIKCPNCDQVVSFQQCPKKGCKGELKLVRVGGNMLLK